MLYVVRALLSKGLSESWYVLTLSVVAWYIPDTAYSILSGFWQNAVLNTAFFLLFSVPLWAIRHVRK